MFARAVRCGFPAAGFPDQSCGIAMGSSAWMIAPTPMAILTARQTKLGLKSVPLWKKRSKAIRRTFVFKGFMGSIGFVNRVASKAEKCDHHPDIDVRWNKVTLTLSTHSEGGITEKDFSLARQCDRIYAAKH
jgi:4a-hydroxytetrahydrobiopterin dehydratase